MTGLIFDIKKFAIHDGPGIRTTVFFKGCQLGCTWCHNPESRSSEIEIIEVKKNSSKGQYTKSETIGQMVSSDYIISELEKDRVFYDVSGGGITISGGEPMHQIEFLIEVLSKSKDAGFHTAVDTTGYAKWSEFEKIIPFTDLFLYDIKLIDDVTHVKYTTVSNALIHENLQKLLKNNKEVLIRVPLIPGITDSDENLVEIADFLSKMDNIDTICLLPYNMFGEDKINRFNLPLQTGNLKTQSKALLEEKKSIFESRGFEILIGG